MGYYKRNYVGAGTWMSSGYTNVYDDWGDIIDQIGGDRYYVPNTSGGYDAAYGRVELNGPMQQWVYQDAMRNNPYWLAKQNNSVQREDRFSAKFQGRVDIFEGLSFQARVSIDHTKYNDESKRYASTWGPSDMYRYGTYSLSNSRTNEIYTDYMLSYNKEFAKDWSVSATAGYVAHTTNSIDVNTSIFDANNYGSMIVNNVVTGIPNVINEFYPSAGGSSVTSKTPSNNWDKAALATAQVGWRDVVFVDASYRHDWYRPFKQFAHLGTKESYGYFGVGANAVLSDIIKMPEWWNYAK
jgi:hypothetical protein